MHAQKTPVALGQNLEIAPCLGRLDGAEAVFLPRHVEIDGVITCDLEEYAAVGTAFIGLSGGVQKARAKAHAGRHLLGVANCHADILQRVAMRLVALDIGEQAAIIARMKTGEMRLEPARERAAAFFSERLAVFRIGKNLDAPLFEKRLFGG